MKAKLVVELIKAHSSGEEGKFSSALDKLADDEEKKEIYRYRLPLNGLMNKIPLHKKKKKNTMKNQ